MRYGIVLVDDVPVLNEVHEERLFVFAESYMNGLVVISPATNIFDRSWRLHGSTTGTCGS